MAMVSRFLVVGLLNTAFGYAIILLGLKLGLGDYLANAAGYAAGLALSYGLNRRWTFAVTTRPTLAEAGRFGLVAIAAYAVNIGVLYLARSMGFVDSPLAQAAAMLCYSIVFFLLSRFFAFAGAEAKTQHGWTANYPDYALLGVGAVALVALHGVQPSGDVSWQFWIARQMLGGAQLYADIWEVNPPLWFWSAVPVQWLAERTGIPSSSLLVAVVVALGAASAWLTGRLAELPDSRHRLAFMLLVFWICVIAPVAEIGNREQLALLTSLPYAALIARRHARLPVPVLLAAAAGLLGAYGFALKHYFVLVPLVLELWLALRMRQDWRPWRPEVLVLAALALAYAACMMLFAPEFFSRMVPMVGVAYGPFEVPLGVLLTRPWVFFWLLASAFLILYRHENPESREATPLLHALLLMAGCFGLAYLIQSKGWFYHAIPVSGALAIAVGLRLMQMRRQRALPFVLGLALLALPASTVLTPRPDRSSLTKAAGPFLDRVAAGEAVFVAATDNRWTWPAIEQRKLVWTSRLYSMWIMPAIARGELFGPNPPELQMLAAELLKATSEDIRCNTPALILIERTPITIERFSVRDFLFRDQQLRQFVAQHYVALPATEHVLAYQRIGPPKGIASSQCRAIR